MCALRASPRSCPWFLSTGLQETGSLRSEKLKYSQISPAFQQRGMGVEVVVFERATEDEQHSHFCLHRSLAVEDPSK